MGLKFWPPWSVQLQSPLVTRLPRLFRCTFGQKAPASLADEARRQCYVSGTCHLPRLYALTIQPRKFVSHPLTFLWPGESDYCGLSRSSFLLLPVFFLFFFLLPWASWSPVPSISSFILIWEKASRSYLS